MLTHSLRVCQYFSNMYWDSYLINPHIRVWRYYCAAREIDSFSGQIPAKPTLLSFEPLNEASARLLRLLYTCIYKSHDL